MYRTWNSGGKFSTQEIQCTSILIETYHRPPDETILDGQHVGILFWVCHADVRQFYIQVLVHRVQRSAYTGEMVKIQLQSTT